MPGRKRAFAPLCAPTRPPSPLRNAVARAACRFAPLRPLGHRKRMCVPVASGGRSPLGAAAHLGTQTSEQEAVWQGPDGFDA